MFFEYIVFYLLTDNTIYIMSMTAAERQRQCRQKRKKYPAKIVQVKKKDLERYHARK